MTKSFVANRLEAALRADACVVSELGVPLDDYGPVAYQEYRQEPHSGGLGWAFCVMGMKLADPERFVVVNHGRRVDMFANPVAADHAAEAHGIALLVVILNNAGYGAVERSVTDLYPTGYAAKADQIPLTSLSPSPDFRLVAESCLAWARPSGPGRARRRHHPRHRPGRPWHPSRPRHPHHVTSGARHRRLQRSPDMTKTVLITGAGLGSGSSRPCCWPTVGTR